MKHYVLINEFKRQLKKRSEDLGLPNFSAHWEFADSIEVRGNKKNRLLDQMINLIVQLKDDLVKDENFWKEFKEEDLPPEVTEMGVVRGPIIDYIYWGHSKFWMSGEMKQDELEKFMFQPIVDTPDPYDKEESYAAHHERNFEIRHVAIPATPVNLSARFCDEKHAGATVSRWHLAVCC